MATEVPSLNAIPDDSDTGAGSPDDRREAELVLRIRRARTLLRRSDSLLGQLEVLNLGGVVNAPWEVEEAAIRLLDSLVINVGDRTVQELVDRLFEGQEAILGELQSCRSIRLARALQLARGIRSTTWSQHGAMSSELPQTHSQVLLCRRFL
jgi:hypothetical protein